MSAEILGFDMCKAKSIFITVLYLSQVHMK